MSALFGGLAEPMLVTALGTAFAAVAGIIGGLRSKKAERERREVEIQIASLSAALKADAEAVRSPSPDPLPHSAIPQQSVDVDAIIEEVTQRLSISRVTDSVASAVEKLISSYHEQALSQAKIQFWFSVVAAAVGFTWILYAGVDIKSDPATLMKTLPGVVMDAVAFLFFKQASETRERATSLYDRLRTDKQMNEAAALVKAIKDERVRSVVQAQIALHMAGLPQTALDLSSLLPAHPTI